MNNHGTEHRAVTRRFQEAIILCAGFLLLANCTPPTAVSPQAYQQGLSTMERYRADSTADYDYLVIVDFSQPSDRKRMQVHNLKTGSDRYYLVAHGAGNGARLAERFSNAHGSHQSSLGLFSIGKEYTGRHGRSLYLFGLEDSLNGNAFDRYIVLHAANYVTSWTILKNRLLGHGSRIGRSWGCFAVSPRIIDELVDELQQNGFIYAWSDLPEGNAVKPTDAEIQPASRQGKH